MQNTQKPTPFYVVSMGKFTALYLCTMGLYGFYWFFKNWQLLGEHQQKKNMPIFRAIFHIFFFPGLCQELSKEEKKHAQQYRWNPAAVGFGFIILEVISVCISYLVLQEQLHSTWLVVQYPILLGHYYFLYKFQLVANRVCNDPFGHSNSNLSMINHGWIIFGIMQWFRHAYVLYSMTSGETPAI